MTMFERLQQLAVEEEGADATEYALLAALIAVALIVGATTLGGKINGLFNGIAGKVNAPS
jgi:pilus assembly protein Flp/PilA